MHRDLSQALSRALVRELVYSSGITGTAFDTLSDATSTASGTHLQPVTGTSAATLDALTSSGTGTASDAALDFNFLTDTIIAAGGPAVITFTRASTATYYNSSGVLSTAAIDAPRLDHDRVTPFASRGLLVEEGRTNLALRSAEFSNASWTPSNGTITADQTTAPDGTVSGDLITGTNTTVSVQQTITISSGATVNLSTFFKAGNVSWCRLRIQSGAEVASSHFGLSPGSVGTQTSTANLVLSNAVATELSNGWVRCSVTVATTGFTSLSIGCGPAASNGTFGVAGNTCYIWGAQCEVGGFVTSYIPTAGSTVGRSVDSAVVGTLSPWFNATEGTIYCEITPTGIGTLQTYTYFDDTTSNERFGIRSSAGSNAMLVVDGGVTQVNSSIGTVAAGTTYKCAFGYKLNDFGGSQAGAAIVTDTGGTLPTVTRFLIGTRQSAGEAANAYFKRVKVYNTRKTNADIVALTA